MKHFLYLLLLFLPAFSAVLPLAAGECADENTCQLPGSSPAGKSQAILSPVGKNSISFIKQAPRLSTLNGKNIAIVGGSFMASVTHPELKRLIQRDYPQAKVYLLSEI